MWKRALALVWLVATLSPAIAQPPVEVMVLGTQHLQLVDQAKTPVAIDLVRRALLRFQPDLVVVEWLHPSVKRAKAFNYAPLGDLQTLGKLWGHVDAASFPIRIEAYRAEIARAKAVKLATAPARIELGKLLYLSGDQLNAAYQWWRAGRDGADVTDLRRLTRNNMAGHELEVWGFEIAAARDHEYVTPFDYQGDDIGSEIWGEMLERLRDHALATRDGLAPGAPGYDAAAQAFDAARERFEGGTSDEWLKQWGKIPEVREYARAWRSFALFEQRQPKPDAAGLAMIRWLQSDDHLAVERELNDIGIRRLSIGGLGAKRVEGNVRRNQRMAEFALADIKRLGARRVLVIVGATHRYFLKAPFKAMGLKWVPSAGYVP